MVDVKKVTKEEYFNEKESFIVKEGNVDVTLNIRYNQKPDKKLLVEIENEARQAITGFDKSFNLKPNTKKAIDVYIFNDQADYSNLDKEYFNLEFWATGGEYHHKEGNVPSEIYFYQAGNFKVFKHEFVHALTYISAGNNGDKMPRALIEGIAKYYQHDLESKFNAQGSSIDMTLDAIKKNNLTVAEILNLKVLDSEGKPTLLYEAGHALVMYLQEKAPELLKSYFGALNEGDLTRAAACLDLIGQRNHKFKSWLTENDTDTAMRDINALQVTKGDFVATRKEVVGNEIKDISYYKANIETMSGENVGEFSTIAYLGFNQSIRVNNISTNDILDLPREYNFLKLIKDYDGKDILTFVDANGSEYRNSKEYETFVFDMICKTDLKVKQKTDEFNLINEKRNELYKKYQECDKEIIWEKEIIEKEILKFDEKYVIKLDEFNKFKADTIANIKNYPEIDKTVAGLIIIPVHSINGINDFTPQEGKIYSVKALGSGMTSTLSVYDGGTKCGELLTESGYFKQVDGQDNDTFIFHNNMQKIYSGYNGDIYLAVTKENEEYKVSLIDGRKVDSDDYSDKPHLHQNEFLNPSINHIQLKNIDSLLINNTQIFSHKDSTLAHYSEEQKTNGVIVEKEVLLDNKGSDTKDDDVYLAKVIKGNEKLYEFKNVAYSISEEVINPDGSINKSDFLIHDHGKNIRYQLPKSVDHLKLLQKNGVYKLVPSDKNGVEYTDIPDEYRYIDPIFVQQYEKRDYSHKLKDTGLVDFSQYGVGTLFAIEHDPEDYHIKNDANGNILRINDNKYITKVKLFHNGNEIGKLSNEFHNFEGGRFISADFNYSYNDFLASYSPQINIESLPDSSREISFERGDGDIGDTDRGYTDHKKIFINAEKNLDSTVRVKRVAESEKPQASEMQNDLEIQSDHNQNSLAAPQSTIDITYDNLKALYDSTKGAKQSVVLKYWYAAAELEYQGITSKEKSYFLDKGFTEDELSTLNYLIGRSSYAEKNNREKIPDFSSQGAIQDVVITYEDIKKLYTRTEGKEKNAISDIWTKLHKLEYKIPFSAKNDLDKIDITTFIDKMDIILNPKQKPDSSYKMESSNSYYVNNRPTVDSSHVNFEDVQYEIVDIIGTQQQESQYIA